MFNSCEDGLGSLLISNGTISKQQLGEAQKNQRLTGRRLKDVLVKEGYTTSDLLKQFVVENVDIPYVKLSTDLIDPEAVKLIPAGVARSFVAIPITLIGDILTIAVSCPFDLTTLDMLAFASGYSLEPVLSDEEDVLQAIDYFFKNGSMVEWQMGTEDESLELVDRYRSDASEEVRISEGPVVKLFNMLLAKAIKDRASDIHIEPEEGMTRVRFRIDGILIEVKILPPEVHNTLVSRIKVMSNLDISEKRMPQDGRFFVKYKGKNIDFRVATSPTIYGESATVRVLDQANGAVNLQEIGLEKEDLGKIMRTLDELFGLILVVGPTGSGKTTTQYAMLNEIKDIGRKIITIEDPVEYRLNLVTQIPVNPRVGLDFSTVLRSVLRQDPDIVLLGEIRDKETASVAVQAALTGHLLLSTLHTTGAPETLTRLLEMGVEPYYLQEVVKAVVAQRLVRKLCPECKESYAPGPDILAEMGLLLSDYPDFYRPRGCKNCNATGYRGRTGVYEVMPICRELRSRINRETTPDEIRDEAIRQGMSTMWSSATKKVLTGDTSVEEIRRAIPR